MTMEEYEKEAMIDCEIGSIANKCENISEFLKNLGFKIIKWSKYSYEEERISNIAEAKLQELYKKKIHYYTFECDYKIEKKQLDVYVSGDEEFSKAQVTYKNQLTKQKFVERTLDTISKLSFNCNYILKHQMWQAGEYAR